MDLFDYLKRLTETKEEWDERDVEFEKGYNPFIISRFVSMAEAYLFLANEINKRPGIPKETHYNYYLRSLPKRRQFFKYIKKNKDDLKNEDLKKIANYFEIGKKEVELYVSMLSESQINRILDKFKGGEE